MSNHSGIDLSRELTTDLAEFLKSEDRALILKIEDEQCILETTIKGSCDLDQDLQMIRQELGEDDVRYILIKLGPDEYVFGNYVPEASTSRDRMVYASSRPLIEKRLPTHESLFWSDANELVADVQGLVKNRGDSVTGRAGAATWAATGEESRTAGELEQKKQQDAERVARPQQQSGANVALDLPSDAVAALRDLAPSTFVGLVVEGEDLHMHAHAQGLAAAKVSEKFGPRPGYAVYQDSLGKNWFIYRCPDQSKVKDRMIAASCRNGVLEKIRQFATIDETIETSDEIELAEDSQPAAPDQDTFVGTEIRRIKRPSKPGRVRK